MNSPNTVAPVSQSHRIVLAIAGALLIVAELSRFPQLLASFRDALDVGGVISLSLSILFAVQLIRGRWLLAAICFLVLFLAIEVWATLQMPVAIDGSPFRYPVFLSRLPFMLVHFVVLATVLYVSYWSVRNTRNAIQVPRR